MLYKTVKVPLWVYEDALDARADVLRQGLQFLPKDLLEPANCPRCGGDLEVLTAGYQRLECTSCGFKQEKIAASGTNMSGIGLGVLLGLGLAALFRASTGGVRPSREAVAGRAAAAPDPPHRAGHRREPPVRRGDRGRDHRRSEGAQAPAARGMRIVVDTNVLVSGFLNADGVAA